MQVVKEQSHKESAVKMELGGATIEIDGIYAEEMGVDYWDMMKNEYTPSAPGPVTIYRLVKREDAEAMGISLKEGSISTPNQHTKVITRQIIKLKKKPKNITYTQNNRSINIHMGDENEGPVSNEMITMMLNEDSGRKVNLYPCEICRKAFRHVSHLRRHINTHTKERAFKCEECQREFLDSSTLTRHRRTHTGDKPYSCKTCNKSFGTLGSLRRHITCHNQESRPYCCEICNKRFPDNSSFLKHRLIHTGIKRHICDICNKAFVHVGDLNGHKKIHIDIKPHKCDRCKREFSKHSNFARHLLIHEGRKEYVCHICDVGYNYQSSLTRHLLTHKSDRSGNKKVKVCGDRERQDGALTLREIRSLVQQQNEVLEEDEETEDQWIEIAEVEDQSQSDVFHEGEMVLPGEDQEEYEVVEVQEVFVNENNEIVNGDEINYIVTDADGNEINSEEYLEYETTEAGEELIEDTTISNDDQETEPIDVKPFISS